MTNSVKKKLLAVATVLGALASNNASANESIQCGSTTASNGALTIGQTECISGNGLYFYLDVDQNNTALEIQTSGGTGEADILINTSGWATSSSYSQRTNNAGTEEMLAVTANSGRLYVSVFGAHQQVTLDVREPSTDNTDTGSDTAIKCSNPSSSNATLAIGDTRCTSGNGLYFSTYIEQDNTPLTITTTGGEGNADLYVSSSTWANSSNNDASSTGEGTEESISVTANTGQFYISLMGAHQGVSLSLLPQGDTGGGDTTTPVPEMCGTKTLSGYVLTLNSQECISGNGQYYYIDIEADDTDLLIETKNGTGEADIYVNTGNWASRDNNIASSINEGTDEALRITANAGRLYISIFGSNQEVSFKISADDGSTDGGGNGEEEDYLVIDKDVQVSIPAPSLTSADQFTDVVKAIIAGTWTDWAAIASGTPDPIADVADAIHFLAAQDDMTSTELDQLVYFLRNYAINGATDDFSTDEVTRLSNALHAVAKMSDFHSTDAPAGLIQEGYATAVINLAVSPASDAFTEHLPHLLALTQYYSELTNPYSYDNFGYSTNQLLKTLYDMAWDAKAKPALNSAFNDNMLSVISALRTYGLNETALDLRWDTDKDKKWILAHLFLALGHVSNIADEATQTRIDSIVIEIYNHVTLEISEETAKREVAATYLDAMDRTCDADDALSDYCLPPATVDDILTITHACSADLTIRAQAMTSEELDSSCQKMADMNDKFHNFFNTGNQPVGSDTNAKLEVIVYASPEDYEEYGFDFFGHNTDNGGMYLEGDPSVEGNVARFHAMQCPSSWVGYSCVAAGDVYNLEHEYTHYLDGRYNLFGAFQYHDNTTSWAEGMAEYLANGVGYERSLDSVDGSDIPSLYSILFTDYDLVNLYPWSYFAMQYLAEERPETIVALSAGLRSPDNALFQAALNDVAETDGTGFLDWVAANTGAIAPPPQVLPPANTFGSCDLVYQYNKDSSVSAAVTITNTTDTPVTLYLVNGVTGQLDYTTPLQVLGLGESYTASTHVNGERIALTDNYKNCLGVAVLTESNNTYDVDAEMVKDAVSVEVIPAANTFGSCDLTNAYDRAEEGAAVSVTNATDTAVNLYWVSSSTGEPNLSNNYQTLNNGDTYSADYWAQGDRLMVADSNDNCLGVAVLSQAENTYVIDADSFLPVDPTDPVDPVDPTDPVDPVDPVDPTDPVDPVDPTDPVDPVDPTDPVDPVDPTDPVDPVVPTIPTNPGMCGADTIVEQELTFNQVECVNVSGSTSYYIYVPADNIEVTMSTDGGSGELTIYTSQETWANSSNFEFASSNVGTTQSVTLIANSGWLYVALDAADSNASEVSFLVATDTSLFPSTGGGSNIPDDGFPTDATRFLGLNADALVERIALTHPQNVSPIYNISGADATQIYSEANMIAIANAINARAPGYADTDSTGLEALFYFLRGSYYVSFAHPDDVPDYTDAVKASIKKALRAFFNNSSAWIASESNGGVLKEALISVDSAGLGADFNDVTIRVLTDYNDDWSSSFNMNAAANSVFTTLFRAQWDDAMKAIFIADDSILDVLYDFQNMHRDLIGTDAEYVLQNAVNEMARLYHVDALFPRVKSLVKAVLNSTSKDNETKALWIKAASMSDYYDRADCGYYDICGFAYTLEAETLTFNYKCSDSLKIRAQGLFNEQAAWICEVLGNQETNFHSILGSGYQPVADDNNSALELVIFNSATDYQTYAGQFFGIATNNGGMYLEGAPINEKNQARFIAYEAAWMQPNFHVWNLQHEYVHYLDGRFDLYGGFSLGMTVNTVWWSEGLGEYISYGDGYERAIEVGKSQEVALSEVFKNNYGSGQTRVYQWGYLAVRFMFENHRSDVEQILSLTRTGQYTEYQTFMDSLGTSYDAEFNDWLVNGVVLGDNNIVEFGPNDTDSASSGTAGNWAGEPLTISTDFSPCEVDVAANTYDEDNRDLASYQVVECINSKNGGITFTIRNNGNEATRFELRTTGGWGNSDIMFKAGGYPSAQDNDGYANADGNWDSLVIELQPDVYWNYITLDGEFGGVRFSINKL